MKKKLKCFVCHKEINEEEDYVFKGQTVHKGVCLKSMIDEYNAVRNLQIRNKRLCSEIDRLNNILDGLKKWLEEETRLSDEIPDTLEHSDYTDVLDKLKKLKEIINE